MTSGGVVSHSVQIIGNFKREVKCVLTRRTFSLLCSFNVPDSVLHKLKSGPSLNFTSAHCVGCNMEDSSGA